MGMPSPHHYHVAYIAASRMSKLAKAAGRGTDWVYLPAEGKSMLLMQVGADERRVFDEVAEMLDAGREACSRWVA